MLISYQYTTASDNDPGLERGTGGLCWAATSNSAVTRGGDGTQVFVETIRDRLSRGAVPGLEARVTAHEIGHQLGLGHWDTSEPGVPVGLVAGNLMKRSMQDVSNADAKFCPQHIHQLRSRVHTPGQ